MRIGIDLYDLDPDYAGGVNSFAFGIVAGLRAILKPADELVFLVSDRNHDFLHEKLAGPQTSFLNVGLGGASRRVNSMIVLISWIGGNFRLRHWYDRIFRAGTMRQIDDAVDVLYAPLTVLRFFALRTPALLSMHDIQQEYHPQFFTWRERVSRWAPYRLSCHQAAAIQASSHYIRQCLLEKFSFLNTEKIFVISEGVDREKFSLEAPDETPPEVSGFAGHDFVFYPAQIWPHKNHLLLIEALARFRDRTGAEMRCVLTGQDYGHWRVVEERIAALGLKQIHYLGRVSFSRLLWLYRNCRAVLALGMHESSSLPLREGAVFGKALIALDIPPNLEARDYLKITLVHDQADLEQALAVLSTSDAAAGENSTLVSRFDWKVIAGDYYPLLRQLAQARS